MYALVEIKGQETKVNVYNNKQDIAEEMIRRYNNKVKEAKSIYWKNTYFEEENMYAKIDDLTEIVELRVTEIDIGEG